MKKILIILIIGLITVSCNNYKKADKGTEISQEIITFTHENVADTLIVLKNDDFHYYFKQKNGQWVIEEKYYVDTSSYVTVHFLLLLFMVIIGLIMGFWIFADY